VTLCRTRLAAVLAIAQLVQTTTASAAAVGMPRGFEAPGPLAVTDSGTLYVASGSQLYKLSGRRFEAFARASSEIQSAVAVANGTVYLGEANVLQAVSPSGAVTTVAHMAVAGLGLSRQRALYVVTDREVGHFDGDELKTLVRAAQFKGLSGVPPLGSLDFGNVDADGAGDLYISGTGDGYNLYELTKTGHARFVSPFRGANGKAAPLSIGPDGVVYGEWQNAIYQVDGGGISLLQGFSGGTVPKYHGTFLPAFIASSGVIGSPLDADADGANGFSMDSAIIAVYPKHRVVPLWARSS
jgi:hypothetical protein